MTATDELRRMLDERGVEWAEYGDGYTLLRHGGREYTVQPNVCNRLIVTNLTPEQAIAATLGDADATATRHGDADLKAENAKLREELESVGTAAYLYGRSDLKAENDKLRELVNGWDFCSKTKSSTFDNCVGCPLFIQTPHSYRCARDERMRELGVEVDA